MTDTNKSTNNPTNTSANKPTDTSANVETKPSEEYTGFAVRRAQTYYKTPQKIQKTIAQILEENEDF